MAIIAYVEVKPITIEQEGKVSKRIYFVRLLHYT